jgi:WD40 repeat protein
MAVPPDPLYNLRGSSSEVTAVAFLNPNDEKHQLLASGSSDGQVTTWSLITRRPVCKFAAHRKSVLTVEFAARFKLISQGRDGFIRLWALSDNPSKDTETASILVEIPVNAIGFCPFSTRHVSRCNTLIAFPGEDKILVNVVAMATDSGEMGQFFRCLMAQDAEKVGMCMALRLFDVAKQQFVAGGFECGDILVWRVENGSLMTRISLHKEPLTCFTLDSTCLRGISGAAENVCQIFEFKQIGSDFTSNCVQSVEFPELSKGVSDVAVRSDDKICAIGCWDGLIRVFSWRKLKPLAVLAYHTQGISSLVFSQTCGSESAMLLAAGSKDKRISIWSLYN